MATVDVKLKPFTVPNFVREEKGDGTYSLGQINQIDLMRLCIDFRASVFKNAGKKDPLTPIP
jgi:hypothetical protein